MMNRLLSFALTGCLVLAMFCSGAESAGGGTPAPAPATTTKAPTTPTTAAPAPATTTKAPTTPTTAAPNGGGGGTTVANMTGNNNGTTTGTTAVCADYNTTATCNPATAPVGGCMWDATAKACSTQNMDVTTKKGSDGFVHFVNFALLMALC